LSVTAAAFRTPRSPSPTRETARPWTRFQATCAGTRTRA